MNIFIGIPVFRQSCSSKLLMSCLKLQQDLMGPIAFYWHIVEDQMIERARNECVHVFLQSECSHLLFIDDDIEFEPNHVLSLMSEKKPVISGVYALRGKNRRLCAWHDEGHSVRTADLKGAPFRVRYTGAGFLLIERSVLQELSENSPEYRCRGETMRKVFNTEVVDGVDLGEDYAFCKRCHEHSIPIYLHPKVDLIHWGPFGHDVGNR